MTTCASAVLIVLLVAFGELLLVELNELLLLVLLLVALLVSPLFCLLLRPPTLLFVDLGVEVDEALLLLLTVGLSFTVLLLPTLLLLPMLLVCPVLLLLSFVVVVAKMVFVMLFVLILTFKLSSAGAGGFVFCCDGVPPGELLGEISLSDLDRANFAGSRCSESCCCWSVGSKPLLVLMLLVVALRVVPAGEVGALKLVVVFIWHLSYDFVCPQAMTARC